MKKILVYVCVAALLMAAVTPAFATSGDLCKSTITGGASQRVSPNCLKTEPNSMDVHITSLNLNGQEQFRFAGYSTDGTRCTVVKDIVSTGYRGATYTSNPTYAFMKMSIKSSNTDDCLYVSGTYAI